MNDASKCHITLEIRVKEFLHVVKREVNLGDNDRGLKVGSVHD